MPDGAEDAHNWDFMLRAFTVGLFVYFECDFDNSE